MQQAAAAAGWSLCFGQFRASWADVKADLGCSAVALQRTEQNWSRPFLAGWMSESGLQQIQCELAVQRTNDGAWSAVTSSSDGSRLAATLSSGTVYISTDSGATWTAAASAIGNSMASSADGSRLSAALQRAG